MSAFPGSPRLIKGGIVQVDPSSGARSGVIALQYNPDTLTRIAAGAGGRRARAATSRQALRLQRARPSRRSSSRPRSTPPTRSSMPDQNPDTVGSASIPSSPRWRRWCTRRPTALQANDALAARRRARGAADRGAADAVRLGQQPRRAGARHRPVGHRGGVRRHSTRSGRRSASACGSCRSTTSASTTAAARCSWATCATRKRWRPRRRSAAPVRARDWRDLTHARPAAGAARRRRAAADVVPADEPLRRAHRSARLDRRRRQAAGAVPAARGCCRSPSGSRCSTRTPSSRATGATCWPAAPRRPGAVVAARRRERRRRPASSPPPWAAAADHAAGKACRGWVMLDGGVRLPLLIGPLVTGPGGREVDRRGGSLRCTCRLRRHPERLRAHLRVVEALAADTLFLLTGGGTSRSSASSSR